MRELLRYRAIWDEQQDGKGQEDPIHRRQLKRFLLFSNCFLICLLMEGLLVFPVYSQTNPAGNTLLINYGEELDTGTLTNSGLIDNYGYMNWPWNYYGSNITNNSDGKIINESEGHMKINRMDNIGVLDNSGIMGISGGFYGLLTNENELDNSGTLGIASGTFSNGIYYDILDNKSNLKNDGTINNGGEITNESEAKLNNSGTLTNKAYATLDNSGDLNNSGTLINGGKLINLGTLVNKFDSYVYNTGTMDNSGKLFNEASAVLDNGYDGSTYYSSAILDNTGTISNSGIINSYSTLKNESNVDNAGYLGTFGKLDNSGKMINEAKATLDNSGYLHNMSTLLEYGTLDNQGTLTNESNGTLTNDAMLTNESGASLNNSGELSNSDDGKLRNFGTLINAKGAVLGNSGNVTNATNATLDNSGNFYVFGTLDNYGKLTNSGTLAIQIGLSVNILPPDLEGYTGTLINESGATLENDGTISNTSGTVINAGIIDGTGTFTQGLSLIPPKTINTGTMKQKDIIVQEGRFIDNGIVTTSGVFKNEGTLTGNGTINSDLVNEWIANAGNSPGELTINGSFTQTSTGKLITELGGSTQGISYDWLNIIGTANLAGSLDIELYDGFTPSIGETFEFLTATDGIFGSFDSYVFSNSLMRDWTFNFGDSSISIQYLGATANPTPEPSTLVLFGFGLVELVVLVKKNSGATSGINYC